eukprot:Hpha_TRINITY_DN16210_c0_g3::TRINITY_DN16210_c0_g3_i2::g.14038::m.14038
MNGGRQTTGDRPPGQTTKREKAETSGRKGNMVGVREGGTVRKGQMKDEKAGWDALNKLYADETKERKKLEDDETKEREKSVSKERNDEWAAINKYWEKSTKEFHSAVKGCETGETQARNKLEKEQTAELDALGKHRDGEGRARGASETSEDKPRKDIEKEWQTGHDAIAKLYNARQAVMDFLQISKKPAGDWGGSPLEPEKVTLVSAEARAEATFYNIEVLSGETRVSYIVQARYSVFDSLKGVLEGFGLKVEAPFPGKGAGMLGSMFKKMASKAVDERKVQLNQWIQQACTQSRTNIERQQAVLSSDVKEVSSRLTSALDATESAVKAGEVARNKRNEERRAWFAEQRERLAVYAEEQEEARRKDQQLVDDRERARLLRKQEWQESSAADMEKWEAEQKERQAALEAKLAQDKAAREEKAAAEGAARDRKSAQEAEASAAAAAARAEADAKTAADAAEKAKRDGEEAKRKAAEDAEAKAKAEAAEAAKKKALAELQQDAPATKARGKSLFNDDSSSDSEEDRRKVAAEKAAKAKKDAEEAEKARKEAEKEAKRQKEEEEARKEAEAEEEQRKAEERKAEEEAEKEAAEAAAAEEKEKQAEERKRKKEELEAKLAALKDQDDSSSEDSPITKPAAKPPAPPEAAASEDKPAVPEITLDFVLGHGFDQSVKDFPEFGTIAKMNRAELKKNWAADAEGHGKLKEFVQECIDGGMFEEVRKGAVFQDPHA